MTSLLAALWLLACGPRFDCSSPDHPLATAAGDTLTCEQGDVVVHWLELLGGRSLPANGDRELVLGAVADRFTADPAGTRRWLAELAARGGELASRFGLAAAEARSHEVWLADHGEGLVRPADAELWNLQSRALSVWTKDDEEQLALTESDLEGWIRFASLCHEAQGGGGLKISVADRVEVYQMLIDRFQAADRAGQVALASLGPVWPQVVDAWAAASYERQQAWIKAAPLPPPMKATSLGYAEAVFQGDVTGLASSLQSVLGPFGLDPRATFEPPAGTVRPEPAPLPVPPSPAPVQVGP